MAVSFCYSDELQEASHCDGLHVATQLGLFKLVLGERYAYGVIMMGWRITMMGSSRREHE